MGHVVSVEGIRPNPKKVEALVKMVINSCGDAHSFLGLGRYYRKFVKNFAKIAAPLTKLTRDGAQFEWGPEQEVAFNKIKTVLLAAPLLAHPDFAQPFIIQTDACDLGLGVTLCQRINGQEKVIAYLSRTLSPAERKWSVREKEALGIIWGCETCRPYLIGAHFTVETDHESLQWLLKAEKPARLVRWALRLSEFDFTIKYKRGKANGNADALSRLPVDPEVPHEAVDRLEEFLFSINSSSNIDILSGFDLKNEQSRDGYLKIVIDYMRDNPESKNLRYPEFELTNGILYKKESKNMPRTCLIIPFQLRSLILKAHHNCGLAAHVGMDRTYEAIAKRYFWPGMYTDTKNWI